MSESRKKLNYREKSSIHFVNNDDPPFIKNLKQKVGYKAPATVEDKFASTTTSGYIEDDKDEDDLSVLKEEDRPQIVVLDTESDLDEKQVADELKKQEKEKDQQLISEGKILFRKPQKRGAPTKNDEKAGGNHEVAVKKSLQDRRLLSFGDADEDEDDG
ncbi:unnamed protein product [Anisakis simplex]|uniref:DUF4604 domain-containing protein n=1 Tax=Anisakis simplex TaxID=6269 RepID=A0A0M3JX61_ANISI|nr:unnamed protein product [Anisakis simplex]